MVWCGVVCGDVGCVWCGVVLDGDGEGAGAVSCVFLSLSLRDLSDLCCVRV